MSKRLQVPPELESLIEKREQEADRRKREQRSGGDKRAVNLGPGGAVESANDVDDVPTKERRGGERRKAKARRKQSRRKQDD